MDWLRCKRPDLMGRYEKLYRRGAYAPAEERERLSQLVRGHRRAPANERGIATGASNVAAGTNGGRRARDQLAQQQLF
jgi:hypothetical protein